MKEKEIKDNIVIGHALAETLGKHHCDVLHGKGGFWIKDKGFFTLAQARKITGIKATPKPVKMINRVKP